MSPGFQLLSPAFFSCKMQLILEPVSFFEWIMLVRTVTFGKTFLRSFLGFHSTAVVFFEPIVPFFFFGSENFEQNLVPNLRNLCRFG